MLLDAFSLLVTKAAFIGLRLIVLYLVAASLGSSQFGAIAFAMTVSEFVRFAADWGIDTLSLRAFSNPDWSLASAQFRSILRVKLASAALAFALCLAIILPFSGVQSFSVAVLLSLTSVSSLWLNLAINWLQARGMLRPAAIRMGAISFAAVAVQLGAHALAWAPAGRFAAMTAFELAMVATMLRMAFADLTPAIDDRHLAVHSMAGWLRASTPIALATILALSYARFDQVYIRIFFPLSVLGDFALAARLVEPMLFVVASMTSTLYARASTLVWQGAQEAALRTMARKWIVVAASSATVLATVMAFAGSYGLARFFPQYVHTPLFLWITLAALPFRCVNLCLTAFLQALGQFRSVLRINLFNFANIAVLVMLGGHFYGFVGAALAVVAGEAVNTIVQARKLVGTFHERKLQ